MTIQTYLYTHRNKTFIAFLVFIVQTWRRKSRKDLLIALVLKQYLLDKNCIKN